MQVEKQPEAQTWWESFTIEYHPPTETQGVPEVGKTRKTEKGKHVQTNKVGKAGGKEQRKRRKTAVLNCRLPRMVPVGWGIARQTVPGVF